MRAKWIGLALTAILLAVAAPCMLAGENVVRLGTSRPLMIGDLTLEPGSYVLRASDRYPTNGVVTVVSEDNAVLGKVFVRVKSHAGEETHATKLIFSGDSPNRIISIDMGCSETCYEFPKR